MKLSFLILLFTIQINSQWTQTNLGNAQYGYNIYLADNEIFAATLNGVYSTTDLGNPWFSLGLSNRLVFDVIKSNQYILAATEATGPGVYRSSDHGNSWIETNGMANQSVRAFTKNSSYTFACTWGGGVFRSNDDGANWQSLGLTNDGFRSIYTVGEKVFVGGSKIYFSTNNGDTWDSRQLPYPAGDTWCFYYDNGILYAGDMGLYVSNDLGNTWTLKYGVTFDGQGNATDSKIFRDIVSYNNTLIASVAFNSILISYDGGNNWSSFNDGLIADWTFAGLVIKDPNIWALTTGFGNAYMRPLSNVTTIEESKGKLPTNFSLEQNYPNPFNPTTIIRYALPSESKVTIKIYNLLGQEIKELVNNTESAGYHEVNFNASNLASGIYFYRIVAASVDGKNNFVDTKKFILLK